MNDLPADLDLPEPMRDAGFVDIASVAYGWRQEVGDTRLEVTSKSAKLFYSLVAAESDPKQAPLFLVFNGGPGGSTMGGLRAHGATPHVINPTTGAVEENPYSWSKLGNLLFVDARQTGFSYSVVPDLLAGPPAAAAEMVLSSFSEESFNDFLDAADFVRVLLAVYAKHPALADNPVVIVGESYGGVRAQLILNALRDPDGLESGNDSYYNDPELADSIRTHRAEVSRRRTEEGLVEVDPGAQFSWQVLIQPALVTQQQPVYSRLKGTPVVAAIEERARELGIDLSAEVNIHRFDQTSEDMVAELARTTATLLNREAFAELIGLDPTTIAGLSAKERQGVARFPEAPPQESWYGGCPTPANSWLEDLGVLGVLDCYYMMLNEHAARGLAGSANRHSWQNGRLFLRNLQQVNTFITRALLDLVVVADAIPYMALGSYVPSPDSPNPLAVTQGDEAIVAVKADFSPAEGVARPGHIDVTYRNIEGPKVRRIRFPTYENSGHEVAGASPVELYEDLRQFLCAPGTP